MGDQEKPIWEGEVSVGRMRIGGDLSIWRPHEGDVRPWMEVDGEWFKAQPPGAYHSIYEVALCEVARERDKLRAEKEAWQRASGCANPETISVVIARFYEQAECRPPLDGIPDGIARIKAERDALRDRFAKLEAVATEFVDAVDVYENSSGNDVLYEVAKEKHGALILLLDSAKGSGDGQTEAK